MPSHNRALRTCPALEILETRYAPACTVALAGNPMQLQVRCDGASDRVLLDHVTRNTLLTANGAQTVWADDRFVSILIQTGAGDDSVDLLATVRPVIVNTGAGRGNTVNLGRAGSTQGLTAAVEVSSTTGVTALSINHSAARTPLNVLLNSRIVSGLAPAPIMFMGEDLLSLTLRGGTGGNTFAVQDTPSAPTTLFTGAGNDVARVQAVARDGPLVVNTEAGSDTVQVGSTNNTLATIQGALTVRGQTGSDRLLVQDQGTQAGQNYSLSARTFTRPGIGTLTYETVDTLEVFASAGPDGFTVTSTANGTRTLVHGGTGDDRFSVGTPTSSLDNIDGPLRLTGGMGRNQVYFNDAAARGPVSLTIDTSEIYRSSSQVITLDGISFWFFTTSNGDDEVLILDLEPGVTATFDFGDGNDLLTGQDIRNAWTFTGLGAGNINNTIFFSALENAVGGSAPDTFNFGNGLSGQGLAGYLDGGAGVDTLDYSGWATGVYVDLYNYVAPNTAFVVNIPNVLGGLGDDNLHGDYSNNRLDGNAGHDILVGDEGNDTLLGNDGADQLYGGGGADSLAGGPGEDLLIDGTTNYDYDVTALSEIWLEWTRTDLPGSPAEQYAQRVANLRFGTGLSTYLLDANNVFTDGEVDQLLGGAGDLDWFWAADGFDTTDRVDPDEALN